MAVAATSSNAVTRQREQTLEGRQARLAFWLLLPTFIVLVLVALYPLGRTFLASFTDEPFAKPEQPVNNVGLANYQRLLSFTIVEQTEGARLRDLVPQGYRRAAEFNVFGRRIVVAATDPEFIESVQNTVIFTVVSVILELILGLGVALVVNINFRGRGLMRAAMLIPWAIPTAISTVLWRNMLGDNSAAAVNAILTQFGILQQSVAWRTAYPLASIIFVDVWKTMPYMALLLLAGLQTIPGDLYEAGSVDGANTWQKFQHITLPMLRPTIVITLIFRTLDALRVFDLFQVMFGYATRSMATYNHEKLTASYEYGYASAIGVFIFVVIFAFTILYMNTFRADEDIT
ncbi:MAG: sugar ABC transporter permease [Anaerolineae bacterium]|nr:sugar ABC transporter permease [Anaerolineae bacterium]